MAGLAALANNAVFCIDCGVKNVNFATYCRKCGSKLQKSEEAISVEAPLSIDQTETISNNSNPFTNIYQEGKYLHVGIKGISPISGKIISVEHTMYGTLVTLENNATLTFGKQHDSNYTFIDVLDKPYAGSCNLINTQWGMMNQAQKRFLIIMIVLVTIIDILYMMGWIMDELNTLSDNISCGISQLYNSNSNNITYKQICDINNDDCDMLHNGRVILICSIIGFLLLNILIWFCICVNIFYNRHFMKARAHSVCLFIGFVLGGAIVFFAFAIWGGRNSSTCDNGCKYYATVCTEYKNGITMNMIITIASLSMLCGALLPAISSSNSFSVT